MRIKIEWVSDINFVYPYLEVFYKGSLRPIIDIGINNKKQLNFKFYKADNEFELSIEELEHILKTSKEFLTEALENEEYNQQWSDRNKD